MSIQILTLCHSVFQVSSLRNSTTQSVTNSPPLDEYNCDTGPPLKSVR